MALSEREFSRAPFAFDLRQQANKNEELRLIAGEAAMLEITFEFVGGPLDGNVYHGVLGEASDAERYYLFTNHGAIGQKFRVASQYAVETLTREQLKDERRHSFQRHYYVVTDRLEDGQKVWVRAEYSPERVKSGE